MASALYRMGRQAASRPWRVVGGWLVAVVVVAIVSGAVGGDFRQTALVPGTDTQRAADLIEARFPARAGEEARVVFAVATGQRLDSSQHVASIDGVVDAIRTHPHVERVATFTEGGDAAFQLSPGRRIGFVVVQYDGDHNDVGSAAVDRLRQAIAPLEGSGLQAELGGDVVEFNSQEGGGHSELIGLGVAVMILLVAFGSVVAMGLPILTALLSLGVGLMLVTLGATVLDIPEFGPQMATMIGLGVGIDYALFIVTRYRENLARGLSVVEAIARANATSGQAVVFAGATVVIAILGLMIVGLPWVSGLGQAAAIVVAVTVAASVTLLPALLGLAGRNIDRLKLPARSNRDPATTLSGRWARRVSRRPWPWLVASLLALVVMAVPVFSIRLGQNDAGTLPESNTLRRAYDLLAEGFGPGFNGPLVAAVDLSGASADSDAPARVAAALREDPGVAFSLVTAINETGDTAIVAALLTTSPQDEGTEATLGRLRSEIVPPVESATGAEVFITGSTAAWIDIGDKIQSRLPWFVLAVIGMSFLLLMVVFRSLLVPAKAALMNLLGIGASYGILVAVFQWGWGKDLVGLDVTVPIIHFLPMFMFAILFGLSMDYEVFLMSRIREDYLHNGGDNLASVETGIATTARVITAAAIIMISVFGSFAVNDDIPLKMSGIGLAIAIFLDATLIRMVLVPATMAVAGRANWWIPAWLERHLPHLEIEGETALPPLASESVARTPFSGAVGSAELAAHEHRTAVELDLDGHPVDEDRRRELVSVHADGS